MGYFSQKKKHQRENVFLKISLVVLAFMAFVIAVGSGAGGFAAGIGNLRFQLFVITVAVFAYSLFHQRFLYAVCALALLLFYYGFVASHTNLFFNSTAASDRQLKIIFAKDFEPLVQSENYRLLSSGHLNLAPNRQAYFITLEQEGETYTVVSLNLTYLQKSEQKALYENLADFVLQRDEPVIIVGNFGIPAWHPVFKDFLSATSLNVKNKVLLRDNQGSFNPFITPRINVLGFDNVGISHLNFTPNSRNLLKLKLDLH